MPVRDGRVVVRAQVSCHARASSHAQRGDLDRQAAKLTAGATFSGRAVSEVVAEPSPVSRVAYRITGDIPLTVPYFLICFDYFPAYANPTNRWPGSTTQPGIPISGSKLL